MQISLFCPPRKIAKFKFNWLVNGFQRLWFISLYNNNTSEIHFHIAFRQDHTGPKFFVCFSLSLSLFGFTFYLLRPTRLGILFLLSFSSLDRTFNAFLFLLEFFFLIQHKIDRERKRPYECALAAQANGSNYVVYKNKQCVKRQLADNSFINYVAVYLFSSMLDVCPQWQRKQKKSKHENCVFEYIWVQIFFRLAFCHGVFILFFNFQQRRQQQQ